MYVVYYIETNLICIIVMLLFNAQLRKGKDRLSENEAVFDILMWATVALCATDLIAGIANGWDIPANRLVSEISNLFFFELLVVIGFIWTVFVERKLGLLRSENKRRIFVLAVPLLIFTAVALVDPFTHFLFTVDDYGDYSRADGIYFHWAIMWLYMIYPLVRTAWAISHEKNKLRRQELMPLLYFIIAPLVGSVVQMLFYGVTSTQVGITISVVLIYLNEMENQIITDALTGLNNRRGLDNYIAELLEDDQAVTFTVIMLDLNNFKLLNDNYGHQVGDRALVNSATALKRACTAISGRPFLCRYGGDEFLIVGVDFTQRDIEKVQLAIRKELGSEDSFTDCPFSLQAGIGIAIGTCKDDDDVNRLLEQADEAMYADKVQMKSVRA